MFEREAMRLLRDDWATAKMLAEELFAMFQALDQGAANGPVAAGKTGPGSTGPYFKMGGYQTGDSLFQITGAGGDVVGDIKLIDGNLVFEGAASGQPPFLQRSGTSPYPDGSDKPAKPKASGGGGGGGIPGKVFSGGPGDTYLVDIYPDGLGAPSTRVTVTQLQIDPAETIPADTWAVVTKTSDGLYQMQVPVWM